MRTKRSRRFRFAPWTVIPDRDRGPLPGSLIVIPGSDRESTLHFEGVIPDLDRESTRSFLHSLRLSQRRMRLILVMRSPVRCVVTGERRKRWYIKGVPVGR